MVPLLFYSHGRRDHPSVLFLPQKTFSGERIGPSETVLLPQRMKKPASTNQAKAGFSKTLDRATKNKNRFWPPRESEDDGTRTRNHRIDSPVL